MRINKPCSRLSSKQNQRHRNIAYTEHYPQECAIESWKENTGGILADCSNLPLGRGHHKSVQSKSRLSTHDSLRDIEHGSHKISQIELLKRQAEYLDSDTIEQVAPSHEFVRTEPTSCCDVAPAKIDNWIKTTSNGFFRAHERYATLEKKRHRVKKLRKIDVLSMNGLLATTNTKMFKESILREIQQINKPLILYPVMDMFYHEEIKQRLNTPLIKNKQNFKKPRVSTSEAKECRGEKEGEPIRVKTIANNRRYVKSATKRWDSAATGQPKSLIH